MALSETLSQSVIGCKVPHSVTLSRIADSCDFCALSGLGSKPLNLEARVLVTTNSTTGLVFNVICIEGPLFTQVSVTEDLGSPGLLKEATAAEGSAVSLHVCRAGCFPN